MSALSITHAEQASEEADWVTLFNGSSLAAWKGYQTDQVPSGWVIEKGTLCHEAGQIDLVSREEFADFDLRFEWRIAENGNSGVIYRCTEDEPASYMTGPEYQLLDNEGWQIAGTAPGASGALYGLFAPAEAVARPAGEWNTARIVVRHHRVEHWLNGKRIVTAELNSERWRAAVSDTKFAAWKHFGTRPQGHIALQAHKGRGGEVDPVWFRNIKVRRLPASSVPSVDDR